MISTQTDQGLAALQASTVPDIEASDHDADAAQAVDDQGHIIDDAPDQVAERMTKDAFWGAFKGSFKLAAVMSQIPELAVQTDETEHARAASDAVFELIEAIAPSWLSGDKDQLVLIITAGSFFAMKAKIVSTAIQTRQAARIAAQQRPAARQAGKPAPQPAPQPAPRANDPISTQWETEVEVQNAA